MAVEARPVIAAVAARAATAFVNAAESGRAVAVRGRLGPAIVACGRAAGRDATDHPDFLGADAVRRDLIAALGTAAAPDTAAADIAAADVIRSWAPVVSADIPGRGVATGSEVAVQQDTTEAHAAIRVLARRTVARVAVTRAMVVHRITSRRFFIPVMALGFTWTITGRDVTTVVPIIA